MFADGDYDAETTTDADRQPMRRPTDDDVRAALEVFVNVRGWACDRLADPTMPDADRVAMAAAIADANDDCESAHAAVLLGFRDCAFHSLVTAIRRMDANAGHSLAVRLRT